MWKSDKVSVIIEFFCTFPQKILNKQSLSGCDHSESQFNEKGESKVSLLVRILLICLSGNLPKGKVHYCPKDWNLFLPATTSIKQGLKWN